MFDSDIHNAAQASLSEKVICLDWRECKRKSFAASPRSRFRHGVFVINGVAVTEQAAVGTATAAALGTTRRPKDVIDINSYLAKETKE